jgi:hypothetical protein
LIAAAVFAGIAVASTLRPSARAVLGLTPGPTPPFFAPAIAWWSRSCPPQNAWSPNVSKRKIRRPRSKSCWLNGFVLATALPFASDALETLLATPLTISAPTRTRAATAASAIAR